jgi:hypothetical protein
MCGAQAGQQELAKEQAAFYQQTTAQASVTFGEDQALLKQMQAVYDPILAKGPNQQGFSAAELSGLNSEAVEGTAQNYQAAGKAVNEQLASEGGGNMPGVTGSQEQLKEDVAAAEAGQQSSEESQIQQADYGQGYNEFQQATAALEDVSGQFNPTAYDNAATGAGSAANTTYQSIAAENTAAFSAVTGAINGAAGAASPMSGGGGGFTPEPDRGSQGYAADAQ